MLVPGILYVALGALLKIILVARNPNSFTSRRMSTLFIMVGAFNVLVSAIGLFIPESKTATFYIGSISIVIFGILFLMEFNKDYRRFMDHIDKHWDGD